MPSVQAPSAESGRGASVIYYATGHRAIVQSAYDPLPPTAPLAARSPGPARRFCPGCDPVRRRPPHQSETPNHFRDRRLAAPAPIAGTGRLCRSRISDAGRAGARHGRSSQPDAEDARRRAASRSASWRIEDDDHRRLRTSLDHVVDRSSLGMKSSAFSTH